MRLEAELQRLSFSSDPGGGPRRALVLEVTGAAGWQALAAAWQGVQADLELPAPGIAVSGGGCQLWFSLAEPVPPAQGAAFLEGLRRRYLGDVKADRVKLDPAAVPPPREEAPGRWSAFVAPDLAAVFADEPWLDLPPSPDAQADVLARLQPMKAADLARALERLQPPVGDASSADDRGRHDPRTFLLQTMNDPAVALHLRIEAAKALLPYFEGPRGG